MLAFSQKFKTPYKDSIVTFSYCAMYLVGLKERKILSVFIKNINYYCQTHLVVYS